MPLRILIVLILGAVAYFIFRTILQFKSGISGTRSAVKKDFLQLEEIIDQFELSPWQEKELELLSRNHEVSYEDQMYARVEWGQFFSIYEEPIMAFATKEYFENERRLAVVRFNGKKYFFNTKEDRVELTGQNVPDTVISIENGLKIKWDNQNLFLDTYTNTDLMPMMVNDEHKFSVSSTDDDLGSTGRLIHRVKDHEENETELILLSIAFALANKQI